jgi:hypothetical protein
LDFEGEAAPGKEYHGVVLNDTKATPSTVRIVDRGTLTLSDDGMDMRGRKLRGQFTLRPEEKGSEIWVFEPSTEKADDPWASGDVWLTDVDDVDDLEKRGIDNERMNSPEAQAEYRHHALNARKPKLAFRSKVISSARKGGMIFEPFAGEGKSQFATLTGKHLAIERRAESAKKYKRRHPGSELHVANSIKWLAEKENSERLASEDITLVDFDASGFPFDVADAFFKSYRPRKTMMATFTWGYLWWQLNGMPGSQAKANRELVIRYMKRKADGYAKRSGCTAKFLGWSYPTGTTSAGKPHSTPVVYAAFSIAPSGQSHLTVLSDSVDEPIYHSDASKAVPTDDPKQKDPVNELLLEAFAKGREIPLFKADEERLAYGVVLEPEIIDAQKDIYSDVEVRTCAHTFMEKYMRLARQHREFVDGKVKILESFIAPCDFTIGTAKVKKGSWVMAVRVLDDALWKDVKAGKLTGFSIGGTARRVAESLSSAT